MTARPVVPTSTTVTRGDLRVTIAIGSITIRRLISGGEWCLVAWFLSRWDAGRFLDSCGWGDDFVALADEFEARRDLALAARDEWYAARCAERVAS